MALPSESKQEKEKPDVCGVYLAVSARLLVNLASLNMAGSVGNMTRYRRAPVTFQVDDGSYRVVYVPVISGMSLAHHYQLLLARAAAKAGLHVSQISLQGYFMKYANDEIIERYYQDIKNKIKNTANISKNVSKENLPCVIEKVIVENDVVADVGGFLYTDKGRFLYTDSSEKKGKKGEKEEEKASLVKRTSRFSFSYMVPTLDTLKAAAVYPQLHVRYTPEARKEEQALIYIDNASALYTLTYILEASEVSILNVCKAMNEKDFDLGDEKREERVMVAVEALAAMLGNMAFGAKRSRSFPHWEIRSMVVVASKSIAPFIPSPGHDNRYLMETMKRLEAQKRVIGGMEAVVYYYAKEKLEGETGEASRCETPEDAIHAAAKWVIERLKKSTTESGKKS